MASTGRARAEPQPVLVSARQRRLTIRMRAATPAMLAHDLEGGSTFVPYCTEEVLAWLMAGRARFGANQRLHYPTPQCCLALQVADFFQDAVASRILGLELARRLLDATPAEPVACFAACWPEGVPAPAMLTTMAAAGAEAVQAGPADHGCHALHSSVRCVGPTAQQDDLQAVLSLPAGLAAHVLRHMHISMLSLLLRLPPSARCFALGAVPLAPGCLELHEPADVPAWAAPAAMRVLNDALAVAPAPSLPDHLCVTHLYSSAAPLRFGDTVECLQQLQSLALAHCSILGGDARGAAGALRHLSSLTSLALEHVGWDEGGATRSSGLWAALQHLPRLHALRVCNCPVLSAPLWTAPPPHLTRLHLDAFPPPPATAPPSALPSKLHHLVLRNQLIPADEYAFEAPLRRQLVHLSTLTCLELTDCPLMEDGGQQGGQTLAAVMRAMPQLRTLLLIHSCMTPMQSLQVCSLVAELQALRHVGLGPLDAPACGALASALQPRADGLTALQLAFECGDPAVLQALAGSLQALQGLRLLRLEALDGGGALDPEAADVHAAAADIRQMRSISQVLGSWVCAPELTRLELRVDATWMTAPAALSFGPLNAQLLPHLQMFKLDVGGPADLCSRAMAAAFACCCPQVLPASQLGCSTGGEAQPADTEAICGDEAASSLQLLTGWGWLVWQWSCSGHSGGAEAPGAPGSRAWPAERRRPVRDVLCTEGGAKGVHAELELLGPLAVEVALAERLPRTPLAALRVERSLEPVPGACEVAAVERAAALPDCVGLLSGLTELELAGECPNLPAWPMLALQNKPLLRSLHLALGTPELRDLCGTLRAIAGISTLQHVSLQLDVHPGSAPQSWGPTGASAARIAESLLHIAHMPCLRTWRMPAGFHEHVYPRLPTGLRTDLATVLDTPRCL